MSTKAIKDTTIQWTANRGRNGFDVAGDVADDQTVESLNLIIQRQAIAQKRHGAASQSITGTFSGFSQLARFVPGQDTTAAELHFLDRSATTKLLRVAAGTAASSLTLTDAVSATPQHAHWTVLNGKLYWAYDSGVNRLHVFDPSESTSTVRRVGIKAPGAPSAADTGSGSYTATKRYYRVSFVTLVSGTKRRSSNLGTSVSFTPSGSGTAARVTQPTVPDEGETHWIVWGSSDDTVYYNLSGNVAVATTTYDDSAAVADYADNDAQPDEGAFTPPPSAKYLLSDGNRLLMFGAYETSAGDAVTPRNGRVWFSPVLDTTDYDDDERVSDTLSFEGWIDIARNAGSEDRGLGGPLYGTIFVFQSGGVSTLVPTGDAQTPYRRVTLTERVGAIAQDAVVMGEDETGAPALYWLDETRGPYRYGASGLQWCGYDIQDVWTTVNLTATTKVAHGVYDPSLRAVLFWIATGSSDEPDTVLAFFVQYGQGAGADGVRGGWAKWTGDVAAARCSVVFPTSVGATMGRALSAYVGTSSDLLRVNDRDSTDDNGTTFRAYATSKAWDIGPRFVDKQIGRCYLQASASDGVTIRQSLIRDYGVETRTSDADLSPDASETRVLRKFEDAALAAAFTLQTQIGDSAAVANSWQVDDWFATIEHTEER